LKPAHLIVTGVVSASLVVGCGREKRSVPTPPAAARALASAHTTQATNPAKAKEVSPTTAVPAPISAGSEEDRVLDERPAPGGKLAGIELGEVQEIGPAGPASASAEGVVLVTRNAEALLVPTAALKTPLARPDADFAPIARGPAVVDGFAYFVHDGKLVRRRTDGSGALETLADDARNGSRVSAVPARGGEPAAVAYVTRPDAEGTSRARLWALGATHPLTVEGAGASSVSLVRGERELFALSIDGRSAMTPVHARAVTFTGSSVALGPDRVVWVAGPAQAMTEIVGASDGKQAWGFLPIEKDASHFGLAELALPQGLGEADVSWRLYDNGIDLAPLAVTRLCDKLLLTYARPLDEKPHSPQELVLSRAASNEVSAVVTAKGFASVSLASSGTGGLLVYVADRRTFALPLRCAGR
jgi:hypothetical protein